jgi:hypothetical protein
VPKSRKCGSIHPLPYTPSWCRAKLVKNRDVTFSYCGIGLLTGLVVKVPGYRSNPETPSLIPGATGFSDKSATGSTQPREDN